LDSYRVRAWCMRGLAWMAVWVVIAGGAAQAADNWPGFRGPNGDGTSSATGMPVTWSEQEHVVWKTPIHGKGWSSPVIWGDQIWMTTAPEDGKQLYAVCVDRQSGKVVHDILVFEIADPQYCIPFNSYASPTPVVEEGRVYVHFGAHGTACLDTKTGEKLWTRQDLPCNHFRGPASSPSMASTCNTLWLSTRKPARPSGGAIATSTMARKTATPRRRTARPRSSKSTASPR
jgi:hypothetical protein